MKKVLLTLLSCLFVCVIAHAQDAVFLNNGNVLNGKIIQNSDVIRIVTKNHDTLSCRDTEVRKVQLHSEQVIMPDSPKRKAYVDFAIQEKGWWCSAELIGGGSTRLSLPNAGIIDIDFVNGYRFSEYLRVGLGIGFRSYLNNDNVRTESNPFACPIFANIRGNFISQNSRMFAPYWSFDIGYCIGESFFFQPSLGFRIGQQRNDFILGISYLGQVAPTLRKGINYLNIFAFRIGYEF